MEKPKPGIEMTKPPWLFWIFYPLESLIGIGGILLGTVVLSIGLLLIPILGLTISKEKMLLKTVNVIVIIGLISWLALMVITYFPPTMQHL